GARPVTAPSMAGSARSSIVATIRFSVSKPAERPDTGVWLAWIVTVSREAFFVFGRGKITHSIGWCFRNAPAQKLLIFPNSGLPPRHAHGIGRRKAVVPRLIVAIRFLHEDGLPVLVLK